MGEIVTLQFGGYANLVGAHYWNFQDEWLRRIRNDRNRTSTTTTLNSSHDPEFPTLLYRSTHPAPVPRALIFDDGDSYDALSALQRASRPAPPPSTTQEDTSHMWDSVQTIRRDVASTNPLLVQALANSTSHEGLNQHSAPASGGEHRDDEHDDEYQVEDWTPQVKRWTDAILANVTHSALVSCDSDLNVDSPFFEGYTLLQSGEKAEHAEDRLRRLIEECDRLEGFQCFTDTNTGYAGLATSFLSNIGDFFGKGKPVIVYGVAPLDGPELQNQEGRSTVNSLLTMDHVVSAGCTYVPLSCSHLNATLCPGLKADYSLAYHSSAVLASAVSSFALSYSNSLSVRGHTLWDVAQSLSHVNSCWSSLPFSVNGSGRVLSSEMLQGAPTPFLSCLTANHQLKQEDLKFDRQTAVFRGASLFGSGTNLVPMHRYMDAALEGTKRSVFRAPLRCPRSFPPIINSRHGREDIAALSLLRGGDVAVNTHVNDRLETFRSIGPSRQQIHGEGMWETAEDRANMIDRMLTLVDVYEPI